jgi:hypothetical protein
LARFLGGDDEAGGAVVVGLQRDNFSQGIAEGGGFYRIGGQTIKSQT